MRMLCTSMRQNERTHGHFVGCCMGNEARRRDVSLCSVCGARRNHFILFVRFVFPGLATACSWLCCRTVCLRVSYWWWYLYCTHASITAAASAFDYTHYWTRTVCYCLVPSVWIYRSYRSVTTITSSDCRAFVRFSWIKFAARTIFRLITSEIEKVNGKNGNIEESEAFCRWQCSKRKV